MKRTLFTMVFIGILFQTSFSQTFNSAKLDSFFNSLDENNKVMGSVAISKDGKIIYTKSVGFSDVENKIKADNNSKYRIGSISKTFTSVLVLKAVEEKKLQLNQPIENYFPTIKNAGKITIENMLYHRSGIHNFTEDKNYMTWNTQPKTEKEMIEIISKGGSDFEPDSKFQYSNSNFVLLTYILEKALQKDYSELLKEYITQPLDLKNTYLGGKINSTQNECKSYRFNENWILMSETDISIPLGAGGIISSPSDLVTFADALFAGKLLKPKSLEMMKTIKDQFGIGLTQLPFYEKVGYGHGGGIDGFNSIFSHFPDERISYAITINGTNYNTNDISIAVLSAAYNKPYDMPEFSLYEVSPEDLDKYIGVYSTPAIPMKITITRDNKKLISQGTGQPSFELEATGKDKFKFDMAGIVIEFNPTEATMIVKQGGMEMLLKKE
ncbi:MAG TPA: serine hydrolase domain-containing protein [Draconibacterium sp.]|nr:serine hydrolase domain-containing protein [Draconibacterium sp.]